MKKTNKLLLLIVIEIVSFVLIILYWSHNNAKDAVRSVEERILELVSTSWQNKYDPKFGPTIESIRSDLATNKYTRSKPELTKSYTDFLTKWSKNTGEPKKESSDYYSIQKSFHPAEDSYSHLQENQLMAVITIYLIMMVWLYLIMYTDILRDIVGNSTRIDTEKIIRSSQSTLTPVRPPFSLSRSQLAVWIAIIASLYIYAILWDQYDIIKISTTALLLMGISAGTFATGAILDTSEIEQGIPRSQDEPSSGNFFKDILSDKNGISIQRFQNVIWTVVAIIIYIYRYNNPVGAVVNSLPDLDSTLIALTGVSSATYLMLKTRENIPSQTDKLEVKITLVPDSSLSPPIKDAITKSKDAFTTATVVLSGPAGGAAVNTIQAVPVTPTSKIDFVAHTVPSGQYQTINATWSGVLDTTTGTTQTLKGTYTGAIDTKTTLPISINMQ